MCTSTDEYCFADDHVLSSVGGLVSVGSAAAAVRSVRSFKSQGSEVEVHSFKSETPSAVERAESMQAVHKSEKYRRKQDDQMQALGLEQDMREFVRNQFNANPKEGYFAVKEYKTRLMVGIQAQGLLDFKRGLGTYKLSNDRPAAKRIVAFNTIRSGSTHKKYTTADIASSKANHGAFSATTNRLCQTLSE